MNHGLAKSGVDIHCETEEFMAEYGRDEYDLRRYDGDITNINQQYSFRKINNWEFAPKLCMF